MTLKEPAEIAFGETLPLYGSIHFWGNISSSNGKLGDTLQISDIFRFFAEAELSDILIVAGLIFLFIALAGGIQGRFDLDRVGRVGAGLMGALLLVTGLLFATATVPPQPETPTATPISPPTATPTSNPPLTPTPTAPPPPTQTSTLPPATGLQVTAEETSLTTGDEIAATIVANQAALEVTVSLLYHSNGTVIATIDVTLNSSGVAKVSFGPRPAGRYVIAAKHPTRGRALTDAITVTSD